MSPSPRNEVTDATLIVTAGPLTGGTALTATPLLILIDEFVLQHGAGLPSLVWRGVVPLVILGGCVALFGALLAGGLTLEGLREGLVLHPTVAEPSVRVGQTGHPQVALRQGENP